MQTPLVITMGDPACIGGEVIIKARLADISHQKIFYVVGCPKHFRKLIQMMAVDLPVVEIANPAEAASAFTGNNDSNSGKASITRAYLPIFPAPVPLTCAPELGVPNAKNGKAILAMIDCAVKQIMAGDARALVTAPLSKEMCAPSSPYPFSGHTEYLARLNGKSQIAMLFLSPELRTVPLTIHIPLKDVFKHLTEDLIISQARLIHNTLQKYFDIETPRLAIAGLNPHAGEGGLLGMEEQQIIIPAVKKLQAENINIQGPYAADSLFSANMRTLYDVALTPYHDQALIAVKTLNMAQAVNMSAGLDFVRTSPDHGTAFDIAADFKADAQSMIEAISVAHHLSQKT